MNAVPRRLSVEKRTWEDDAGSYDLESKRERYRLHFRIETIRRNPARIKFTSDGIIVPELRETFPGICPCLMKHSPQSCIIALNVVHAADEGINFFFERRISGSFRKENRIFGQDILRVPARSFVKKAAERFVHHLSAKELSVKRMTGDMRRSDVGNAEKRWIDLRLQGENVKHNGSELPASDAFFQSLRCQNIAPGRVDEDGVILDER
jgi:hypothetical protein